MAVALSRVWHLMLTYSRVKTVTFFSVQKILSLRGFRKFDGQQANVNFEELG